MRANTQPIEEGALSGPKFLGSGTALAYAPPCSARVGVVSGGPRVVKAKTQNGGWSPAICQGEGDADRAGASGVLCFGSHAKRSHGQAQEWHPERVSERSHLTGSRNRVRESGRERSTHTGVPVIFVSTGGCTPRTPAWLPNSLAGLSIPFSLLTQGESPRDAATPMPPGTSPR